MGMFSYACTKCGEKSQFDWANQCVVKIGNVFVHGYYDAYGGVKIRVEGGSNDKASIMAYPEQFAQFFQGWDVSNDALLATDIYCDGDGQQDTSTLSMQMMGRDRMAMLRGMMGGGFEDSDDEETGRNRHCAPEGINILDALDGSMLETLPKVMPANKKRESGVTANSTKDNALNMKKAKSAKF